IVQLPRKTYNAGSSFLREAEMLNSLCRGYYRMTPEQKARQKIDRQLDQSGGLVQDYRSMDLSAGPGLAVREFPLKTGFADYLLYVDRRVVGAIEAKPEGHTLTGVETQSAKYMAGLPANLPHYRLPLPFA